MSVKNTPLATPMGESPTPGGQSISKAVSEKLLKFQPLLHKKKYELPNIAVPKPKDKDLGQTKQRFLVSTRKSHSLLRNAPGNQGTDKLMSSLKSVASENKPYKKIIKANSDIKIHMNDNGSQSERQPNTNGDTQEATL